MGENFSEEAYNSLVNMLFSRFKSFQTAGREAYHPGLQAMEMFDSLLGHPHRSYRTIHVAGTDGKGSVSNMLAVALASTGLKVGLYTSPHLVDVRERIRVIELGKFRPSSSRGHRRQRGQAVAELEGWEVLPPTSGEHRRLTGQTGQSEQAGQTGQTGQSRQDGQTGQTKPSYRLIPKEDLFDFCSRWSETFNHLQLSFFEITTALAFDWFARQNVDVAVIETGLGGRLDSTNIITPVLSVITSIGLDHCDILGSTLPEIAFEKAGIIKPGVPVVVGESSDELVSNVFRHKVMYANMISSSPLSFNIERDKALSLLHFADKEPVMCSAAGSGQDEWSAAGSGQCEWPAAGYGQDKCSAVGSGQDNCVAADAEQGNVNSSQSVLDRRKVEHLLDSMDLQGPCQRMNLNTVLKSLELWFGKEQFTYSLFEETLAPALAHTSSIAGFHGRWEKLSDSPLVIADIGHNAHGLKENFARLESMVRTGVSQDKPNKSNVEAPLFRHLVIVYGTMADKDWKSVAAMFPAEAHLIFTQAGSPRALSVDALAEYGLSRSLDFETCPDVLQAYRRALSIASAQGDTVVYVGGSAYVVAEVEAALCI